MFPLLNCASGGPAGSQTFEKFDKQVLQEHGAPCPYPDTFVQIFKIWPPGRAAGGKNMQSLIR
jgi:hypothetical protein